MPIPLVKGYFNTDDIKFREDISDNAPIKRALVTETGPMFVSAKWSLNALEFQVFEGWFRHSLYYGSKSFDMLLKISGGVARNHVFYFDSVYQTSSNRKLFNVTAKLIALDKNYDDLTTYETARDLLAGV